MEAPGLLASTLGAVLALVLGGLANWQLRRPFHERLWQGVPWLGIQFCAAVAFLVFAAHLVTLLTGHPLTGRTGI